MKSKYVYYLMLSGIAVFVIALVGGAYGADKLLTTSSNQLMHNRLQVQVLAAQQSQLAQAKQEVTKYQGLATIAQSVVPQDKDQAETVRQVVSIAKANNIALSSITFAASTLGTTTTGPSPNQNLSQLAPVPGIPGVYDMEITVGSDSNTPITYGQLIGFLSALEHNRRTALVNSLTLQPNQKDRSTLSFTLTLEEYIKP
jgi:hypothetical protein